MSAGAEIRLLTPPGIGGIAVVELTGEGAAAILGRCFRASRASVAAPEAGRICYGHVVRHDETLDEVLVCRLPGELSDDVFEVNCHGGMVPARRIVEYFVEHGAREAVGAGVMPGRRLRSLEREIAGQLIGARTHRAADVLLVQLSGRLRAELERIAGAAPGEETARLIDRLRATWTYGHRITVPATVVITGAPNVGKSTLANALVGRERSIVHHVPGTTRDTVTSVASLDGLPVVVVDTAGLRQATDEIERIGVEKALHRAGTCDLVVWVFDHSREVKGDEVDYLRLLQGQRLIGVINKIDLSGPLDETRLRTMLGTEVQRTCALTGRGIDGLRRRMFSELVEGEPPAPGAAVVTTPSVASALDEAAAKVGAAGARGAVLDAALLA